MPLTVRDNVHRVISGTASKKDAAEVVDWFATTVEGQQYLSDMLDKDAYEMEHDLPDGSALTPMQSDLLYDKINRRLHVNLTRRALLRVAAVLLPLLLIAGFGLYLNSRTEFFTGTTYSEIYVPKGEDTRILFQDGTEVYLNADTRIRYPRRFGWRKREVFLEGEAYFNVRHGDKRPFIVHAQHTETVVSGTSFNVSAYSESNTIEVVLDEGRVSFNVYQRSYPMLPGQKIQYDKLTGQTTLLNLVNPGNASLWKKNILHFYDTPLADVIKTLERKYDVRFEVKSAEALKYTYTLTTKQPGIENVLKELQKIAPVRFAIKGDTVEVSM